MKVKYLLVIFVLMFGMGLGCEGKTGPAGPAGATGAQGPQGEQGQPYTPPPLDPAPTITLSYNIASRITTVVSALNTLGYTWTDSGTVIPTGGAQVIIRSADTGPALPDWSTFLNNGGHILLISGSNTAAYCASVGQYFTIDATCSWHSAGCFFDWNTVTSHPILKYIPINYDFEGSTGNWTMTHFAPASSGITGTTLLGINCEPNYIAAVREYPTGGTLTYLLYAIGDSGWITTNDQNIFFTPFIKGYLEWLRTR